MKFCRWCQTEKPIEQFHKNKPSKDGRVNKCKACCYEDQKARRATPEGKEARRREKQYPENKRRYKLSEKGRLSSSRYVRSPDRQAAKNAVAYAVRTKRLLPQPCEICGKKAEAHHWSYLPEHRLDVKWLCRFHHNEEHRKIDQRKSWVSSVGDGL